MVVRASCSSMAGTSVSRAMASMLVIGLVLSCQLWRSSAVEYKNSAERTESGMLKITRTVVSGDRPLPSTSAAARGLYEKDSFRATLVHEKDRVKGLNDTGKMAQSKRNVARSIGRAKNFAKTIKEAFDPTTPSPPNGRRLMQTETGTGASFEAPIDFVGGAYSIEFGIGTPRQNFVGLADTGSSLVWVQSIFCSVCFDQFSLPFYNTLSSTYSPIPCTDPACSALGSNRLDCTNNSSNCRYAYAYGAEGGPTTIGNFSTDVLSIMTTNGTLANFTGIEFGVGLVNNVANLDGVTDGIFGLGRGPTSFPSQIARFLGNQSNNQFGYCLPDPAFSFITSTSIVFGAAAAQNLTSDFFGPSSTPLLTPFDVSIVPYYFIEVTGISFNGLPLPLPQSIFEANASALTGGFIVDTGTTYTVLNTLAYTTLSQAFQQSMRDFPMVDLENVTGLSPCYDISGLGFFTIPFISLQFGNRSGELDYEFGIQSVIFFDIAQGNYVCLAIISADAVGLSVNILGYYQQIDYQITMDLNKLEFSYEQTFCF